MRRSCSLSFTVALLVVITSTVRLTTQETPAGSEVAIVLDLPSPVVDEESIRLTRDLLSELPGGLVRYFSLSSARIEEISAGAAHDFVGQEATKNRTSGVTVTISEAAAIVSRNESIRDQVIQRECGDSIDRGGCGPRVNAAAIETLNELDASTETHLEALAKIVAITPRGSGLVLVTGGLPYRREPRASLNKAAALLRDRQISFTVVRLPTTWHYGGVIRDASKDLTDRLGNTRVLQANDAGALGAIASSVLELHKVERAERASADHPAAKRPALTDPAQTALVRDAQDYALRFVHLMRFVVAREHYDQQVRIRPANNTMPGQSFGRLKQQRVMDSEVALVQLSDDIWFMARRALTVDGKNVSNESPRLEIAGSEQEALLRLANLARQGASWNIGGIRRTINSPTLALWFLTPTVVDRFTFESAGTERVGGSPDARVVRFRETARGALLQVNGAPAPSRGRIWLAPDGSVIKTELILQQPADVGGAGRTTARATITVDYEYSRRFEVWLPSTMSELYESGRASDAEFVSATARYSEYQQFQVGSRIVR